MGKMIDYSLTYKAQALHCYSKGTMHWTARLPQSIAKVTGCQIYNSTEMKMTQTSLVSLSDMMWWGWGSFYSNSSKDQIREKQ